MDNDRFVVLALALALMSSPALGAPIECKRQVPLKSISQAQFDATVAAHGEWLATREDPSPKGARADLSWTDLRQLSLKGINLSGAEMTGVDLSRVEIDATTDLDETTLNCAILLDLAGPVSVTPPVTTQLFAAQLIDADLTRAKLAGASLVGANLSGAMLGEANFAKADFGGNNAAGGETKLIGARLTGTVLAGADFKQADLTDAIWQPKGALASDAPDITTMDDTRGLATLRLDEDQPDTGGMRVLLKAFRDGRNDLRADEVAHALGVAETKLSFLQGNWSMGTFRTVFYGWRADYALDRVRPWLVFLLANLIFLPIYWFFGFRLGEHRLVRVKKDGAGTENIATAKPMARLKYSLLFWLRSGLSAGFDRFNLPEFAASVIPSLTSIAATGRLDYAAKVQSVLSAICLAYALYFTIWHPLG